MGRVVEPGAPGLTIIVVVTLVLLPKWNGTPGTGGGGGTNDAGGALETGTNDSTGFTVTVAVAAGTVTIH